MWREHLCCKNVKLFILIFHVKLKDLLQWALLMHLISSNRLTTCIGSFNPHVYPSSIRFVSTQKLSSVCVKATLLSAAGGCKYCTWFKWLNVEFKDISNVQRWTISFNVRTPLSTFNTMTAVTAPTTPALFSTGTVYKIL